MRIFFTAAFDGKPMYQEYYDLVVKTIKSFNNVIVSPEVGNYLSFIPNKISSKIKDENKLHYEAIKYGIIHSDATIIECSKECFRLGHETTLAIQSRKHVLCISTEADYSTKINNEYYHGAKYNKQNLHEIIENFLKIVEQDKLINRVNLFMSDRQVQYLQKSSKDHNLNVSEYIRKLVEEDMSNK
jgi:hypothetical protein